MPRIQTPAEEKILKDTEAAIARGEDPFGDNEEIVAQTTESQIADEAAARAERGEIDEPAAEPPPQKKAKKAKAAKKEAAAETPPADTEEEVSAEEALAAAAGVADPDADTDDADDDADSDDDEDADADADAAADDDTTAEVEEETPLPVMREDMVKLDKSRDELLDKIDALELRRMDGEITPADFNKEARPLRTQLEDIAARRGAALRAQQEIEAAWDKSIQDTIKAAKAAKTVDYTKDTDAQVQFDAAWRSIAATSKVPLTPKQLHAKAHATVLAQRGIQAAQKTSKQVVDKDATPPPRAATKPPPTLRNLPNAAISNTGGDAKSALARLPGQQFEKAFSKLSQKQKDALTRTDD